MKDSSGISERFLWSPFSGKPMPAHPIAYTYMRGMSLWYPQFGGCLLPPHPLYRVPQGAPAHGTRVQRVSTTRSPSQWHTAGTCTGPRPPQSSRGPERAKRVSVGSVGGQPERAHPSATDPLFLQTSSARGAPWREPCSSLRLRSALSPWATLTAGISSPWGLTEPTRHSPAPAPLKGTTSRAPSHAQKAWGTQTAGLGSLLGAAAALALGAGTGLTSWAVFILCRFRFTLELFLTGEKVQQLGTDGPETLQAWASAIGKVSQPQRVPSVSLLPYVIPHSSPCSSSAVESTPLPFQGLPSSLVTRPHPRGGQPSGVSSPLSSPVPSHSGSPP